MYQFLIKSAIAQPDKSNLVQYCINSCRKFLTKTLRLPPLLVCVKKRARSYAIALT